MEDDTMWYASDEELAALRVTIAYLQRVQQAAQKVEAVPGSAASRADVSTRFGFAISILGALRASCEHDRAQYGPLPPEDLR